MLKQVNAFLASGERCKSRTPNPGHEPMALDMESKEQSASTMPCRAQLASSSSPMVKVVKQTDVVGKAGDVGPSASRRTETKIASKEESNKTPPTARPEGQQKSKQLRIERKLKKTMAKLNCDESTARSVMSKKFQSKLERNKPKSLEELLFPTAPAAATAAHKLEVGRRHCVVILIAVVVI